MLVRIGVSHNRFHGGTEDAQLFFRRSRGRVRVSGTDAAIAQDTVKIGIIASLTGVLRPLGKQLTAAAKLYVAQHGTMVAGKKIELIIKDNSGVPDNAKAFCAGASNMLNE